MTRERSPEIALMELLLATRDLDATRAAVADRPELAALLERHAAGCARVVELARLPGGDATDLAGIRRHFDAAADVDEAASVALYSLGDEATLARASDEIVTFLEARGLLAPDARVLDLGCGVGRLLPPLAARVASVLAIDVSSRMVAAAARRAAGLPNVAVRLASGVDLAGIPDVDLVLAVDLFPYIVQLGDAAVERMFAGASAGCCRSSSCVPSADQTLSSPLKPLAA